MNLSEKIKKIREHGGYTQEELALKIGVPQRTLQNYEVGATKKIPASIVESICQVFPTYVDWFMLSDGESDIQSVQETNKKITILSWSQAHMLTYTDACFDLPKSFNNENVVTHCHTSNSAFALVVGDNKMDNPNHKYHTPVGAKIVIDPQRELTTDTLIIACYDDEVIYKHYTLDMGKAFLSSVNPIYPTIEIDDAQFAYIGTVVEIHIINKVVHED